MAYSVIVCEINNNITCITMYRSKVLSAPNNTIINELEKVLISIKYNNKVKPPS